jgi:hypothetical protein
MQYIRNLRDYRNFLKTQASYSGLDSLTIEIPRGSKWSLPGIKWVGELVIYDCASSKPMTAETFLSLPDLKLINGGLDVSAIGKVFVDVQAMEEIRGEFIEPDYEDGDDFECVTQAFTIDLPVTCKIIDGNGSENLPLVNFVNLANDSEYVLRFEVEPHEFHAGCRMFKSVDEAIAHWKFRFEHNTTGDELCDGRSPRADVRLRLDQLQGRAASRRDHLR